jgi:hypothetical protein
MLRVNTKIRGDRLTIVISTFLLLCLFLMLITNVTTH